MDHEASTYLNKFRHQNAKAKVFSYSTKLTILQDGRHQPETLLWNNMYAKGIF